MTSPSVETFAAIPVVHDHRPLWAIKHPNRADWWQWAPGNNMDSM